MEHMVTTTKNAVKECVIIVLYQLRNGGPLGLIEACSNSATQHSLDPTRSLIKKLGKFFGSDTSGLRAWRHTLGL